MKRLVTFFIVFILWAGSSWGQTTITIGTGTLTGRYPLNDFYVYSRSQCLYLSSEIGTVGTITKLRWYRNDIGANPNAIGTTEIWLMETSNSVLSGTSWEGPGTLVATISNIDLGSGDEWFEIDITDFVYSGTQNLLVSVYTQNAPYTAPHSYWRYTTTSPNYLSRLGNSDSSNPPSMSLSYLRPNIQMDILQSNMTFASSTTLTATTAPVLVNSADQPVVVLQVVTNGALNPFDLTSIDFTTSGTTSTSDITAANVYYTTSPTFSASTQFGSTVNNPSGSFTVTGTQTLAGGNNYFWLCYDISNTATEWNVVDGTCPQFATSEPQTRVPDVTDPAGNRTIRAPLAGTYTIDNTNPTSGTNYNNFTDALDDLNNLGHTAAVTFDVSAGQTFSKTVPASPNNYAYYIMNYIGSASNPVVFQKSGAGANPVLSITGTSATGDIGMFLYGCDYVTFDGIDISDAGTTSSDYLDYAYYLQGPANDNCQYVTIQNCTIDLNKANTSSRGIYSFANAPTSSAGTNSNNTFSGNTIQDAYNGIYLSSNTTYHDENNVVSGNVIQNLGNSLSTTAYGIYAYYQKNVSVTGNSVDNMTGSSTMYGIYSYWGDGLNNYLNDNNVMNLTGTSTSSTMYGIYHSPSSTATTDISGNTVSGLDHKYHLYGLYIGAGTLNNIFNNEIYNIAYTGTSSFIAYGLGSAGGTTNNIYNNYIYDIKAPASTGTPGTRALHFGGGTTANVYFNTVYIDYASTIASNQSAALYVTTSPTTLYLNNNIFVNNCDMTTGTRAVAFYKSSTSLANLASGNNNNLFYAGTPGTKNLIFYNTTPYPTLAEFQTLVTPRENLSVTENPPFTSVSAPYDLHIPNTSTTVAESGGINISGIADDWDGDVRQGNPGYAGTGVSPDIGADEFEGTNPNLASLDMGATALVSPVASGCYTATETVTVTIKNWGTQTIDFSVNNVTVTTDVSGAVTQSLSAIVSNGTLASGLTMNVDMSTTLDMTTAGTYTFNAYTTVTGDGNAANDAMAPVNRTVLPNVTLPEEVDFTGFTGANLTTVFPNWYEATGTTVPGGTTSAWTNGSMGGTSARINLYTTSRNEWIVGPKFTPDGTTYLKLKIAITNWNSADPDPEGMQGTDDKVMVKISTDCGASYSILHTFDASNTGSITNSLVEQSFDLSSYTGSQVIIAFHATDGPIDDTPDYDFHIDDIFIGTPPACPAPSGLSATNITATSADLGWTPGGTEPLWNVEVGLPGFTPGTGVAVFSEYFTPDNPVTASPLGPETDYEFYVQAYCNGFENPKIDYFWMAMSTLGTLNPGLSGGTFDDEGETGEWYQYFDPEEELPWWNIWFYNDPLDITRMKKIRMGFWISSLDGIEPGILNYVINWSTPGWVSPDPPLPAFPMPMDEAFIQRSPLNGPIIIAPGDSQWIELLYIIPDFNPEWVSVDIWGENIIIENYPMEPPPGSPLLPWWDPFMPGGIIVHECLDKDHNVSIWSGPKAFRTACGAATLPVIENFSGVTVPALPDCWSTTELGSTNWITTATANAGGTSPEVKFYWTSPSWTGLSMFISPFINTTGASILSVDFKHFVDWYSGTFTIGVKTTSDGNTWNTVWSISPTGNVGPESIKLVIKNADVGSSTFQIAFFFDGNTFLIDNWYIDDISIAIQLPNVWIGTTTDWHTPSNWGSGVVPDEYDVIVIPSLPSGDYFPVVTSNAVCYDITLETGATIQVVAPAVLTVKSGQP